MKKKSCREAALLCVFLGVLFLLCTSLKNTSSEQHVTDTVWKLAMKHIIALKEASEELRPDLQRDACMQMALYIQEGFRTYGIEESYEAYFGPIKREDMIYTCEILLDGGDELWNEKLAYTYDAGADWYNFREGGRVWELGDDLYHNQEEPIFGGDSFWANILGRLDEDGSYAQDFRKTAIYQTTISQKIDLGCPIRYYGKTGPVEHNDRFDIWFFQEKNGLPYSVDSYLYTYFDERLGIDFKVSYPQIYYYDEPKLEDAVNEALKNVCLYGTPPDTEVEWNPPGEIYNTLERNYKITRQDEKYLSVRVYTYGDARGSAHPGESECGITIDMKTGLPVHLSDVVGEDQTIQALLDSGAFRPLWTWFGISEEEWMEEISRWADLYETLDDYDHDFYLTDDGLGLITSASRYHVCMEADYEALGLTEFLP